MSPRRQRRTAVEDADVIESEEAAAKDVLAAGVFAVHPPGEIDHQLLKDALEEFEVACPFELLLGFVNENRSPGMYGRVHVSEVPFVCRNLSAGMKIVVPQHQ